MNVIINGKSFPAEVMSTPEEIMRGMMGRDSLDGCMVFKTGKGYHSFWMKNTPIALDIIYILKNRISGIHQNCQPNDDTKKYTGIGDHVLEFPAGTSSNWKVGDRVNLYLGSPDNPVQ